MRRAGSALRRAAEAPEGLRDYAAVALAGNCQIIHTGGGHLKWRAPGGQMVITPSTPGEGRSIANCRAKLRQAGFRLAAELARKPKNRRQVMTTEAAGAARAVPSSETYSEEILSAARAAHAAILKAAADQGSRRRDIITRDDGPAEGIPGYLWTGSLAGVVSALHPGDPDWDAAGRKVQAVNAVLGSKSGSLIMVQRHLGESLWWVRAEFSEARLLRSECQELRKAAARFAPPPGPAPVSLPRTVEVLWCTWRLITGCPEEFDTEWKRREHVREHHDGQAVELTYCNAPLDGIGECRRGPLSAGGRAIHLSNAHGIRAGTLQRAELDVALAKAIWDREHPEAAQEPAPDRAEALQPERAAALLPAPAVMTVPALVPAPAPPNGRHSPAPPPQVPSVDQALDAFAAIVDAAQAMPGLRAELAQARARIAELENRHARALAALQDAWEGVGCSS